MGKYNIPLFFSQHWLSNRFSLVFLCHMEFYRMLLETQIHKLISVAYLFSSYYTMFNSLMSLLVVNAVDL